MKKIIFAILIFHCSLIIAEAQNGWQIVQCYNTATSVILSKTSDLGLSTGYGGFIRKTTNSGLNWTYLYPSVNDQFPLRLHWISDNLIFASEGFSYFNTIYKSTNFGNNWIFVDSCPTFEYTQFIDENNIFGLYNSNTLYLTSNAGINWIPKSFPFNIQHLYFADNLNGWVVDNSSRIAHTSDAGTTWTLQQSGVTCYFLYVYFINSSIGWACGDNGIIIKTTNSGNNWFSLNSGVNNSITFNQIKFRNVNEGWAIGNSGLLNRTTNGGLNWSQTHFDSIPTPFSNYYFDFNGASGGYIYGWNSYLSSNNGANWILVDSSNETFLNGDIHNLFFLNQNTGWYCGGRWSSEYSIIRKTTNGGNNWITVSRNFGLNPECICFVNEQTGFAGGIGGNNSCLMKTTNGGNNWVYISSGFLYDEVCDIKFVDLNTGYFVGMNGCYKTTNCGSNWIHQFNNSGTELSIQNNGMFVCYVGEDNTFVLTTNGGNNWIDRSNINLNTLKTVFFVNSNTGWVGGSNDFYPFTDYFWKTTNAGINWLIQDYSNIHHINSLYFINENIGWAVGEKEYSGKVLKTTNSGVNWLLQKTGYADEFSSIKMTSANEGWISSTNGTLLHTTNGGNVFINNISFEIPKKYYLSQNYPNPFNPSTKIKFEVPLYKGGIQGVVSLKVFDILGRDVATLVNEQLSPGTYSVDWNASAFPSGVYFYKLESDDFTETKRMVLIK